MLVQHLVPVQAETTFYGYKDGPPNDEVNGCAGTPVSRWQSNIRLNLANHFKITYCVLFSVHC